ncbi:MAG: hypothetical protein ACK5M7_00770 [Draconibacterium sp.]
MHFWIKLEDETEINTLQIKDEHAQITNQEEEISPKFAVKGNLLEINYLDFSKTGMKLDVYDDETNQLLYSQNLDPEFTGHKVYDLSEFNPGKSDAVLENGDQAYDFSFSL